MSRMDYVNWQEASDDLEAMAYDKPLPSVHVGVDFARPGSETTAVRWECIGCGGRVQAELKAPSRVAKCPMCGHEITV